MKCNKIEIVAFSIAVLLLCPSISLALQSHGAPEGIVAHQIAHIVFTLSMMGMFLKIRWSSLKEKRFWRLVSWGALIIAFWNMWAFTGHELELYVPRSNIMMEPDLAPKLLVDSWIVFFYYIYKMDHFILIPSMVFFYMAMKELLKEND